MKNKKMQEEINKPNKNVYSLVVLVSFIVIVLLSIYTYNKKINLTKSVEKISQEPITIERVTTSDQQKLLKVAKEMSQDKSRIETDRETARLFYAKNASDLTPVGLSEERKKNFIESYITLYDIYKNGKDERNRAKAGLSFLYVYSQSCSLDDWLIEAANLFDPSILNKNSESKKIISYSIISNILNDVNSKYSDKALVVAAAETDIRLAQLKKLTKNETSKILLTSLESIQKVKNATSSLESSTFDMLNADRRILTIVMSAESLGINTKINVEEEYRNQLENTKQGEPADGAYVSEYDLRYLYASYLWNKGGKSNIAKIKKELDVTFTEDKTKNAPGWIYGLSVAEKNPLYSFLKPMSKEYPELADFLKKHGWKNV